MVHVPVLEWQMGPAAADRPFDARAKNTYYPVSEETMPGMLAQLIAGLPAGARLTDLVAFPPELGCKFSSRAVLVARWTEAVTAYGTSIPPGHGISQCKVWTLRDNCRLACLTGLWQAQCWSMTISNITGISPRPPIQNRTAWPSP